MRTVSASESLATTLAAARDVMNFRTKATLLCMGVFINRLARKEQGDIVMT